MITIQEAEKVRNTLGLTKYEFSTKLGYSPTAYQYAYRYSRLSRWMAKEIVRRYNHLLKES
jgi:hypothetical protein